LKRDLFFVNDQFTLNFVKQKLAEGWVLDPTFESKPLRMDAATIFPLVLYEPNDEKPIDEDKPGEFDGVVSLKEAPNAEVDNLLKEGYVIQAIYAKSTILVKRKEAEKP